MAETVLVTGGAGFIGSHLVERLLERGDTVYVVDDLSTGRLSNLQGVRRHPSLHLVVDSILNYPMMENVVGQVDRIVHLAAAVGVRKIIDEPVETITTNVRGSEIVLNLAARHGRPLQVASTSEVYGKAAEELHEDQDRVMGSINQRRWAYACTKALDEFLALAYFHEKNLPVTIMRFFNTVGPRQTGQWGMVIPNLVAQALRNDPITVFGTGEQRRCFCHVADTVEAIVCLMEEPAAVGGIFNIGSTEEVTILELAHRVKERLGSRSSVRIVPYDEAYGEGFEDMQRRRPVIDRIMSLVRWTPTRDLDGIIDDVAASLRPSVPA